LRQAKARKVNTIRKNIFEFAMIIQFLAQPLHKIMKRILRKKTAMVNSHRVQEWQTHKNGKTQEVEREEDRVCICTFHWQNLVF
jgi:hypothetical protein